MTVFDVTLRNKLCRPNYVVADKVSSVSRWRAEKVALAYISYISAFDIDSHRYSHRQQRHRARDWLPTVVTIRFVDCSWATATGVSCSSNGRRWCTNDPAEIHRCCCCSSSLLSCRQWRRQAFAIRVHCCLASLSNGEQRQMMRTLQALVDEVGQTPIDYQMQDKP